MSSPDLPGAERFVRTSHHDALEACRNCGYVFVGHFCPECGQESQTGAPSALGFIHEFLTRNLFEHGKVWRTLWYLVRYPGGLTVDFLEGRRQRFVRPVRLFLGLSFLYFLILTLFNPVNMNPDGETGRAKVGGRTQLGADGRGAVARVPAPAGRRERASSQPDQSNVNNLDNVFVNAMSDKGVMGVLKHRLKRFSALPEPELNAVTLKNAIAQGPRAMFVLMPVFALILKLLFWRHKVPYGAHLLFAFNYHSLLFLGLLAMLIPIPFDHFLVAKILLAVWWYLLLALRNVYLCNWPGALLRFAVISMLYPLVLALGIISALAAALIL